jgi:hypothetical protein
LRREHPTSRQGARRKSGKIVPQATTIWTELAALRHKRPYAPDGIAMSATVRTRDASQTSHRVRDVPILFKNSTVEAEGDR